MANNRKTSFRMYSAWNYQREIDDLNRASEQGWQLVKGGSFYSKFVKNPDVRYRYQLDYRKIDDMARYIETFREQGWEYVSSTFNGWHYLRKLYDPALPEEAYEIFTDRESLQEMNGRWANVALIVCICIGILALTCLIRMILWPQLPTLIQLLTAVIECGVLLRGVTIMRNPEKSRSRRGDGVFLAVFFAVILLGSAASITLLQMRPHFQTLQHAGSVEKAIVDQRWTDFETYYPDLYYLDLSMQADAPMTFSVLNEKNEIVYTQTGTSFQKDGIRLKLPKGRYSFSLSYETGFNVNCTLR